MLLIHSIYRLYRSISVSLLSRSHTYALVSLPFLSLSYRVGLDLVYFSFSSFF